MGRRARQVTQEQHDAAERPKRTRTSVPNVAGLGAGRALLARARDTIELLAKRAIGDERTDAALVVRDLTVVIDEANRRAREAAERMLANPPRGGGRPTKFLYMLETKSPDGSHAITTRVGVTIDEVSAAMRRPVSSLRGAFARERMVARVVEGHKTPGRLDAHHNDVLLVATRYESGTEHALGTKPEQTGGIRSKKVNGTKS